MKRILCVCAAGVTLLAAVTACGSKAQKVTAAVIGKDAVPVALVVEYAEAIDASSVTPETFTVPGREVAGVFVTDKNPYEKPEGPKPDGVKPENGPKPEGPKPEGMEPERRPKPQIHKGMPMPKDGKFVIVALKAAAPEGAPCEAAPCEGAPKPECCEPAQECCEPAQDCCKPAPKPECGEPKPECCEGEKPECDEAKPECYDTKGEDHCADSVCYACLSRPWTPTEPTKPKSQDPWSKHKQERDKPSIWAI